MVTYVFILEEVYLFTMYLFICLFIHLSFIIVTPTYPTHLFIYVGIAISKGGDCHPLIYLTRRWHPITCFLSIYLSIYEFAPQCIYEVDGSLSLIYLSKKGMATYLGLIWQEMATYVFILEEMTSHSIFFTQFHWSIHPFSFQCIYEVDGCLSLVYPSMRRWPPI